MAFASTTYSASELNYSQVEIEALGIVFAVKHFHTYLAGIKFTLVTDHQVLETIFNPCKQLRYITNTGQLLHLVIHTQLGLRRVLASPRHALSHLPLPKKSGIPVFMAVVQDFEYNFISLQKVADPIERDKTLQLVKSHLSRN